MNNNRINITTVLIKHIKTPKLICVICLIYFSIVMFSCNINVISCFIVHNNRSDISKKFPCFCLFEAFRCLVEHPFLRPV